MVTGTITKWATTPKAAPGTMSFSKQFSTITIELRVLDASNGAILAAQTATSTVTQKNLFNNKVDHTLDSAEHKVILQCVDYIKTASQKLPWQGSVVKINAGRHAVYKTRLRRRRQHRHGIRRLPGWRRA